MLIKRDSISKLVITNLESKLEISFLIVKESFIVYSLVVGDPSSGTKNFASLYVDVLMAAKIGQKDGKLSVQTLWIFTKPYIILGLQPERLKENNLQFAELFSSSDDPFFV